MRHGKNGFTLLELLVVLAILAILASVALAQYHQYRQRALDAAARANLRTAITLEEAYATQNGVYVAASADPGSPSGQASLHIGTYNLPLSRGVKLAVGVQNTGGTGIFQAAQTGDAYCAESAHYSGRLYFQASSWNPVIQPGQTGKNGRLAAVDGQNCPRIASTPPPGGGDDNGDNGDEGDNGDDHGDDNDHEGDHDGDHGGDHGRDHGGED